MALLHDAELVERRDLGAEQHQDRLDDGHVDDLAGAGRHGAVQGGGDGEARRQCGDAVGEPERRQRRRTVGLAGEGGESAHRLGDRPEAGPLGVRAGLSERSDPGDDESRVGGEQRVGTEAPALERARAEVLDQHVAARDQAQQHVGALAARRGRASPSACCDPSVFHHRPTPSRDGPWARAASGRDGCSILMTSAPRSPRNVAASGPANSVAASITPHAGERPGRLRHRHVLLV